MDTFHHQLMTYLAMTISYLKTVSSDNSNVSWNAVTKLDLYDVTEYQLFCMNTELLTSTDYNGVLKKEKPFLEYTYKAHEDVNTESNV